MDSLFFGLESARHVVWNLVKNLSDDELLKIPKTHSNNILWHIGHLAYTQQKLSRGLCHLDLYLPGHFAEFYGKGTSPKEWPESPDIFSVKESFQQVYKSTAQDYAEGAFREFSPLTTGLGIQLTTIEEAISFNNLHEGMHGGIIMGMIRALKA